MYTENRADEPSPPDMWRGRRNGETSTTFRVTATYFTYMTSAIFLDFPEKRFQSKTNATMSTTATVTNASQHALEDIELVPIDRNARDVNDGETSLTREAQNNTRDWNRLFQLISCGVSFFVAGVNDGSLGALLPYIIRSYGLTTAIASSV
jgi:hypothetical protein